MAQGRCVYLLQLLWGHTDEEHFLPMDEILHRLEEKGFPCRRKAVYGDVRTLQELGFCVAYEKGKGYHLVGRPFSGRDAALLGAALGVCPHLGQGEKGRLAAGLQQFVRADERAGVLPNIPLAPQGEEDFLHRVAVLSKAVAAGRWVTFRPMAYGIGKGKVFAGQAAEFAPYAMVQERGRLYAIGHFAPYGAIAHFLVARMGQIQLREKAPDPPPDFDGEAYANTTLRRGKEVGQVVLKLENSLLESALAQFGEGCDIAPAGAGHFRLQGRWLLDKALLGWLFSLGQGVQVQSPKALQDKLWQGAQEVLHGLEMPAQSTTHFFKKSAYNG